jgi:hypothetical protein
MSVGSNYGQKDNSTYSVKYLGIVDGAMGILSRKMALQGTIKENQSTAHASVKMNAQIKG